MLSSHSGRRCTYVDENGVHCITLLSQYNATSTCFIHTEPEVPLAPRDGLGHRELVRLLEQTSGIAA